MEDAYDDIATESILTNADKAAEDLPLFPEEEWYEQLLRYGLYLGALFQIICILAVIVSPSSDIKDDLNNDDSCSSDEDSDDEGDDGEVVIPSQAQNRSKRRLEKKKRR